LETTYFLSVNGSDKWDGTSDTNTPGTSKGPWQTFPHAIAELRKLRPNPPDSNSAVSLNILPGTYYLQKTLYLDQRDSYMTLASWTAGDVIISGGIELTPTKMESNSKENIKQIIFEGSCSEAFGNDYRLIPARSPNGGWDKEKSKNNLAIEPYHIIKDLLVETDTCKRDSIPPHTSCPDEDRDGFIFDKDLYSPDWKDVKQTKVLIYHSWVAEFAKIDNITANGMDWKVMFQEPLRHAPVGQYPGPGGWRFLFFNNLALLDDPGEYVCIEHQNNSELSFIPPNKVNQDSIEEDDTVIVSQLGVLIQWVKATHVNINGLKFRHASSEGFMGNWNWGNQAAVRVISSFDVSFKDCEFSHHGMIGLYLFDSGRIQITKNLFYDIGYHSLMIRYDGSHETTDILIENNVFDGCGMNHFWQPSCMWIGGRENIKVSKNKIGNVPYAAMILKAHNPTDGNIRKSGINDYIYHIEYNDFHDYGLGVLNDFGAVYIAMGQENCKTHNLTHLEQHCRIHSHIYNNRIRKGKAFHSGANSLYSDDGSGMNTFENNLMYGEGQNALYHHCGIENLSKNNFIHRTSFNDRNSGTSSRYSTVWAGCEKNSITSLQSYENQRNIYLLDDIEDFEFARSWDQFYDLAPEFHHNLYWSLAPGDAKDAKIYPGKQTWYEWQDSGNDTDSIWQDPLFEDPLNHVYILKENSPARDMGIVQIELDNFGPENDTSFIKEKHD
jgi:hypothetical protein